MCWWSVCFFCYVFSVRRVVRGCLVWFLTVMFGCFERMFLKTPETDFGNINREHVLEMLFQKDVPDFKFQNWFYYFQNANYTPSNWFRNVNFGSLSGNPICRKHFPYSTKNLRKITDIPQPSTFLYLLAPPEFLAGKMTTVNTQKPVSPKPWNTHWTVASLHFK